MIVVGALAQMGAVECAQLAALVFEAAKHGSCLTRLTFLGLVGCTACYHSQSMIAFQTFYCYALAVPIVVMPREGISPHAQQQPLNKVHEGKHWKRTFAMLHNNSMQYDSDCAACSVHPERIHSPMVRAGVEFGVRFEFSSAACAQPLASCQLQINTFALAFHAHSTAPCQ